jgi:hypothetical protein
LVCPDGCHKRPSGLFYLRFGFLKPPIHHLTRFFNASFAVRGKQLRGHRSIGTCRRRFP